MQSFGFVWLGVQGLGVLGHRAMPKLHRILTSGLPKSTHTHTTLCTVANITQQTPRSLLTFSLSLGWVRFLGFGAWSIRFPENLTAIMKSCRD